MFHSVIDDKGEKCLVGFHRQPIGGGPFYGRDRKGGVTIRTCIVLPDGDGCGAWLPVLTAPFDKTYTKARTK